MSTMSPDLNTKVRSSEDVLRDKIRNFDYDFLVRQMEKQHDKESKPSFIEAKTSANESVCVVSEHYKRKDNPYAFKKVKSKFRCLSSSMSKNIRP